MVWCQWGRTPTVPAQQRYKTTFLVGLRINSSSQKVIIIIIFTTIDHQRTSGTWPLLPAPIGHPCVDHSLQESIGGPASLEMSTQPADINATRVSTFLNLVSSVVASCARCASASGSMPIRRQSFDPRGRASRPFAKVGAFANDNRHGGPVLGKVAATGSAASHIGGSAIHAAVPLCGQLQPS